MPRAMVAAFALAACAAGWPAMRQRPTGLEPYLSASPAELRPLASGAVFSSAEVLDRREVLAAAAVQVSTTPERLIAGFRKLSGFTQSELVRQIGRVSAAPTASDFTRLTLEPSEVRALEDCRPSHCGFKLTALQIERFRGDVSWRSSRAHSQAEAAFRSLLAEEAVRYRRAGDTALDPLVDQDRPVDRAREFSMVLANASNLADLTTGMNRRPVAPPAPDRADADEFLYWSKVDLGLKPVISLNHVRIDRRAPPSIHVVITSKQIYASHYFDASLSVTALVNPEPGGPQYLLYVNRSRVDFLKGVFGPFTRRIVRSRVRDGLDKNMRLARIHLERGS